MKSINITAIHISIQKKRYHRITFYTDAPDEDPDDGEACGCLFFVKDVRPGLSEKYVKDNFADVPLTITNWDDLDEIKL